MTMASKIHWLNVPLYDLETEESIDDSDRRTKLEEYRETRGIVGVVMIDPTTVIGQDREHMSDKGPSVEEIDWTGFDDFVPGERFHPLTVGKVER